MRIQLGSPDNTFLDPTTYSQLFTLHGTTMIFLVVVPIAAGFANFLVPLMIGARDVAFPRLNMLSWWLLVFGGSVLYGSIFWEAPAAGWTGYAPLSESTFLPGNGIDAWILGLHLIGISSILGAINFIATIHNMRAPGMSLSRMPLFVWTILIYSYLILIALSSFAATLAMLLIDRNFDGTFFDPTAGRRPAAVAAPVLVHGPPRGVHHGPARLRDRERGDPGLRPQADLRLQGDRGGDGRDRLPRRNGVGAPHVRGAAAARRARASSW